MKILQLTSDWKWTRPAEPMIHAVVGLRARGTRMRLPATPPGYGDALPERRARGVVPVTSRRAGRALAAARRRPGAPPARALRERQYDVVRGPRAQILARLALAGARARRSSRPGPTAPIPARPWAAGCTDRAAATSSAVLSERLAERTRAWLGRRRSGSAWSKAWWTPALRAAPAPRRAAESLGSNRPAA
jgi:hypothetical protein